MNGKNHVLQKCFYAQCQIYTRFTGKDFVQGTNQRFFDRFFQKHKPFS